MIVCYVAGPFRAPSGWGIAENVHKARRFGLLVAHAGMMPLVPHAIGEHYHGEGTDQFWLDGTIELLARCDAIVMIPGWRASSGSLGEYELAAELCMPILDLDESQLERTSISGALEAFRRGIEAARELPRGGWTALPSGGAVLTDADGRMVRVSDGMQHGNGTADGAPESAIIGDLAALGWRIKLGAWNAPAAGEPDSTAPVQCATFVGKVNG